METDKSVELIPNDNSGKSVKIERNNMIMFAHEYPESYFGKILKREKTFPGRVKIDCNYDQLRALDKYLFDDTSLKNIYELQQEIGPLIHRLNISGIDWEYVFNEEWRKSWPIISKGLNKKGLKQIILVIYQERREDKNKYILMLKTFRSKREYCKYDTFVVRIKPNTHIGRIKRLFGVKSKTVKKKITFNELGNYKPKDVFESSVHSNFTYVFKTSSSEIVNELFDEILCKLKTMFTKWTRVNDHGQYYKRIVFLVD